ncbi:hypothetical protein ABW19_dt0204898 [Dactylella cylindrospora]|nr:hypothetical protein ABW19_dt0204898 [Dactylella cylindrospora]
MTTSLFERIPPELLPSIFRHLDEWDLFSVALTCRSFAAEARRLLWNVVSIPTNSGVLTEQSGEYLHKYHAQVAAKLNALDHGLPRGLVRTLKIWGIAPAYEIDDAERKKKVQEEQQKLIRVLEGVLGVDSLVHTATISGDRAFDFCADILPHCLKKLDITLIDFSIASSGIASMTPMPFLPYLTELRIVWRRSLMKRFAPACFYPNLLVLLCQHLCRVPSLESFSLSMTEVASNVALTTAILKIPTWRHFVDCVMYDLYLPKLKNLDFILAPTFLSSSAPLVPQGYIDDDGQVPIYQLFRNFFIRHRHNLESLVWYRLAEGYRERPRVLPLRVPKLRALTVNDIHERDTQLYLDYIQKQGNPDFESLKIADLDDQRDWPYFLKHAAAPFKNLKHFKLEDVWLDDEYLGLANIFETSQEDDYFFGDHDLTLWADILPPTIQSISLLWRNARPYNPDTISEQKQLAKFWFNKLRRLNSVTFKVESPWEDDIVFRQSIRFRRRPKKPFEEGNKEKKICVWHVEPAHRDSAPDFHNMIWDYDEIDLDGDFEGEDGKIWSFTGKLKLMDVLVIRCCNLSGDRGCRHLLS